MAMVADRGTVAVIIPMYNAEDTIAETIESVRRQTYSNLEIVVVDDGSSDNSCKIVMQMAQEDERIRLIRQLNAGVATARNTGASKTTAPYVSFLDADDLWAPDKVNAQLEALDVRTPSLAYCWFCQIDSCGRVYPSTHHPAAHEGDVRPQLARENFIGNGSSMLMHREVFDKVGGFDSSLHARNAQGCEDYMFAMEAAQHFPFFCVPRMLVGYRLTRGNMSSNAERMVSSYEIVASHFQRLMPQLAREFEAHHRDFLIWHARRAASDRSIPRVSAMIRRLHHDHHAATISLTLELAFRALKSWLKPIWLKDWAAKYGLIKRVKYLEQSW